MDLHVVVARLIDALQDEEDEGDDEPGRVGEVQTGRDADAGEDEREEGLHPQEIDAYWLQRRIARAFTDIDADASQKLAEEVLTTLQVCLCSHWYCSSWA